MAVFASSNLVERSFCTACITPLSYRQIQGRWISLTLHSLDEPSAVRPEMSFSVDAQPDGCVTLADLPESVVSISGNETMVSRQQGT